MQYFRIAAISSCLFLAACALPRGGPIEREVVGASGTENREYVVYTVTRDALDTYASWPVTGIQTSDSWIRRSPGARGQIIAPGDIIQISVWENTNNSLLTAATSPAGQLQDSVVSASGEIFVPYVGAFRVAGMAPDHARELLQEKLAEVATTGQVQLRVSPGRQNTIDLVSGAANPGSYPMSDRTMSVLNLISLAGGASPALTNPRVILIRGSQRYATRLQNLFDSPEWDSTLVAGDKVILEDDDRTFIALGATTQETLIPFPKQHVSALEAIALAGGVAEARANPAGILILREYPENDVDPEAIDGPENARSIFALDLTSADGLFSAGKFEVHPDDLVLATESPITATETVLGLIGRMVGISNQLE